MNVSVCDIQYHMESALYGIYALIVFVSEIEQTLSMKYSTYVYVWLFKWLFLLFLEWLLILRIPWC